MRKLEEVKVDYSKICLELGNILFKKELFIKEISKRQDEIKKIEETVLKFRDELFKLSDEAAEIERTPVPQAEDDYLHNIKGSV